MTKKSILLAAGGTGGHLSPALALAESLHKENYQVTLISDERCRKYIPSDLAYDTLIYDTQRFSKNPFKLMLFIIFTLRNILRIIKIIRKNNIELIISFGGYSALAANLSAFILRKKLILHEQNSVAGRLNRLFAFYANKIACSFPKTKYLKQKDKLVFTGLPVRNIFKKQQKLNDKFTILIIGGSQGATILGEIFLKILRNIDVDLLKNIKIIQQVRKEQLNILTKEYQDLNLDFELKDYFHNIDEKFAESDLIISRAGASSIAEILFSEKVSILIPYPSAKDNHQFYNAKYLSDAKAAFLFAEDKINLDKLRILIQQIINNPEEKENIENNLKKLNKIHKDDLFMKLVKE